MSNQFTPPNEAVLCAIEIFALMALLDTATEHENNLKKQILESGQYPMDTKRKEIYEKRSLPWTEFITDPKQDYLIDGLSEHATNANTPWAKYHSEWERRMQDTGYIYGANTTCRIDTQLRDTKEKFFYHVMEWPRMPKMEYQAITASLDSYKRFFELSLKMVAKQVDEHPRKSEISKSIYNKYASK